MSMENSSMMIQKGLETVANVTKMAANISGNTKPRNDRKPEHKPEPKNETKDNQLHNQTVEVKVGGDVTSVVYDGGASSIAALLAI